MTDKKKAMTSAEKVRAYRERMRALGYIQKNIWCTDVEFLYLLKKLDEYREIAPPSD